MSARAGWRLETLGFRSVYRYQAGKDDWWIARLPMGGRLASVVSAADVARSDVPTLRLGERVVELRERLQEGDWPLAVVVNDEGIVLGRVRPGEVEALPDTLAEELMVDGPRTIRGTRPAAEIGEWLDVRGVRGVLVTTADGVLVGYVRRDDV